MDVKCKGGLINYSCVDVSLPFGGPTSVTIGTFTFDNIVIPSWGQAAGGDMLFFGDVNVHGDSVGDHTFALPGTAPVLAGVIARSADVPIAVFPGDIFYNASWNDFVRDWGFLNNTGGKRITEYVVIGVMGNHDYSVAGDYNQGCAQWCPAFFLSDGKKAFHDPGLNTFSGQLVPLDYSLQIFVVGKTCLITFDNYHRVPDVQASYDWNAVYNKVKPYVDTVLFCSHHTGNAITTTADVMNGLRQYFPNLRIRGNVNHQHNNNIVSGDVWMTGGNGYNDSHDPKKTCKALGVDCCPTRWRSIDAGSTFEETGYGANQPCNGLGGPEPNWPSLRSPGYAALMTHAARAYASAVQELPPMSWESISTEEYIQNVHPTSLHDDYISPAPASVALSPITVQDLADVSNGDPEFSQKYARYYSIQNGYARCDRMAPRYRAPMISCYHDSDSSEVLAHTLSLLNDINVQPSNSPIVNVTPSGASVLSAMWM